MKRSAPLKPSTIPMARSTALKPGAPLKRQAFARAKRIEARDVGKTKRKSRPSATAAERAHLALVASMCCCLCRHIGIDGTPAEVHHVRVRHGWGRSGHFATIPLCPPHHRGQPGGIHDFGRAEFTAHYGISEIELLEAVTLQIQNSEASNGLQPAEASNQKMS